MTLMSNFLKVLTRAILLCPNLVPSDTILAIFPFFIQIYRSISLHYDELINLCAQAKINFDILGVSETWNQTQNEILTNVSIEGYNHYDTKSSSQNGGVRLICQEVFEFLNYAITSA